MLYAVYMYFQGLSLRAVDMWGNGFKRYFGKESDSGLQACPFPCVCYLMPIFFVRTGSGSIKPIDCSAETPQSPARHRMSVWTMDPAARSLWLRITLDDYFRMLSQWCVWVLCDSDCQCTFLPGAKQEVIDEPRTT
jgi:hypothetical protein